MGLKQDLEVRAGIPIPNLIGGGHVGENIVVDRLEGLNFIVLAIKRFGHMRLCVFFLCFCGGYDTPKTVGGCLNYRVRGAGPNVCGKAR